MKNIYLLLLTFASIGAQSQFIYWKSNEEIPDQAMVVFNNDSSKTGYIKNNKTANVGLRMLSLDPKLFRHADVEADKILFKEEGSSNYTEIPANTIKHVIFSGEEPTRFDKITVFKFDRKSLEVKEDEPATMFQIPRVDDYIVLYSNYYINVGSNGSINDEIYFYVKQKDSDKTYYMRFFGGSRNKDIFPYLKILAPKNNQFADYLEKLREKTSTEYKEYNAAEEKVMEEAKAYIKENKKEIKYVQQQTILYNARFGFMFSYISKKLEQFAS